jgi:ubiquinone/menaquinone biosynthesis C-methylase UbiE
VEQGWRVGAVATMLARSPRLIPETLRLGLRAARNGVWNDVELAVLLNSERVRQAVPSRTRSAGWFPVDTFLQALLPRLRRDSTVLEVGCGTGRVARHVAPLVGELICSDISRVMVREAKANLAEFSNVRCVKTNGYRLTDLSDAAFDVVYAHAVFFFFDLYPAIAMLDEARRVLREGGACIASFKTMDRSDWAADTVRVARRSAKRGTFGGRSARPFTQGLIKTMYEAVGLRVVDCGYGEVTVEDPHHQALIVVGEATGPRQP